LEFWVKVVLGGITVLTGLHPATVAAHFLLSIVLIAGATSLRAQRDFPSVKIQSEPLVKKIATAHIITTFVVLILGTIVTGSGPHAGDATAPRFPFDLRTVAWLHADVVIALLGITFGLFVVHGTSAATKKRLKDFLGDRFGSRINRVRTVVYRSAGDSCGLSLSRINFSLDRILENLVIGYKEEWIKNERSKRVDRAG